MMPLPPFYQTWGGGRGDQTSALDMLNPSVRQSLSAGAQRALSMVPTSFVPAGQVPYNGAIGLYQPAGFWGTSPGRITLDQSMAAGSVPMVTLHEAAHAFDFMNRLKPSRPFTRDRKDLYERYTSDRARTILPMKVTGGYYATREERMKAEGIGPIESYATGAMLSPESIPPDLLPYFADFFSKDAIRRAKWNYSHGR